MFVLFFYGFSLRTGVIEEGNYKGAHYIHKESFNEALLNWVVIVGVIWFLIKLVIALTTG